MLSRRAALLAGLGTIGALTVGCDLGGADDPTPGPPVPTPTRAPSPPLAGAEDAAEVEARLAGRAASLLKAGDDEPAKTLIAILTGIGAGHRAHQVALAGPEPAARPTTGSSPRPTPSPSTVRLATGLKKLITEEDAAAGKLAAHAGKAGSVTALFWASMAAAAGAYAQALRQQGTSAKGSAPAKAPKPTAHRPVEPVEPEVATRAMVEQLYAVSYGYQMAIGHLADTSFERAAATLRQHRSLRDRLIAGLVKESGEVPVAAPAYDVPVRPKDAASATKLIMTLETALVPFCGQWVAAAAKDEDRELAVATLRSTAVTAVTWGGPLLTWPGYVDQ